MSPFRVTVRPFIIILLALAGIKPGYACDACSSSQTGFSPEFADYQKSHSLSFVSHIRVYGMKAKEMTAFNDGPDVKYHMQEMNYEEKRFNYELRGVYYPHKRVALTGIFPFAQIKLFRDGALTENQYSLADAMVMAQYHLINRIESDTQKTRNRFSIGAGIKLPTGRYNMKGYEGLVDPKRQPGTGSVDFLFNVQYLLLFNDFGMNSFAGYKINTRNRNDFRFANTFNGSLRFFYDKKIRSAGLIPNLGLNFEQSGKDQQNGKVNEDASGGRLLSGLAGLDVYYKGFGVSFTYYLPLYEKLTGDQFETKHQFFSSVRYVFEKKCGPKRMRNL